MCPLFLSALPSPSLPSLPSFPPSFPPLPPSLSHSVVVDCWREHSMAVCSGRSPTPLIPTLNTAYPHSLKVPPPSPLLPSLPYFGFSPNLPPSPTPPSPPPPPPPPSALPPSLSQFISFSSLPFTLGACTCVSFEPVTRHCLVSFRPSKRSPLSRHLVSHTHTHTHTHSDPSSSTALPATQCPIRQATLVSDCPPVHGRDDAQAPLALQTHPEAGRARREDPGRVGGGGN